MPCIHPVVLTGFHARALWIQPARQTCPCPLDLVQRLIIKWFVTSLGTPQEAGLAGGRGKAAGVDTSRGRHWRS